MRSVCYLTVTAQAVQKVSGVQQSFIHTIQDKDTRPRKGKRSRLPQPREEDQATGGEGTCVQDKDGRELACEPATVTRSANGL